MLLWWILPGLGGMDSFYSIGLKPSLDNMADYVASFIKLSYKRKKVSHYWSWIWFYSSY